ncbi:hypothetical protein HYU13_06790, partial [Candidatus Woesearchaeota archaeon]|nr:hypothetical protein [Candidatus Woesearchaeota archaeon]
MAAITTMPDREYRAGKGNSQQSPGIQNKPLDSAAGLLLMFSGVYRDASTFRAYVQQRADRLGYKEQAIKEPSSYIPDERAMLERAKAILASPNFHASESSAGFLEKALQKADALERAYAAKAGIAEYNSGRAELKSQDFAYVKSLMRDKVEALKDRAINYNSFINPSEGISPSSYPPTSQSTSPSSPFPSPHSPPSHSPSPPPPSSHSPLSHSSPPPSSPFPSSHSPSVPFPSSTYRLHLSDTLE